MKILLTKVPSDIHVVSPPLSLAYLASTVRDRAEVKIIDCLKEKYNHENFKNYVEEYKPDIVGFTAFSLEVSSVLKCAEIVKHLNKKTIIILGGPHASTCPEVLESEFLDFIFRGEAEVGFPILIEELTKKRPNFWKIPGLGYKTKKENSPHYNDVGLVDNLDSLPLPSFDLMKFDEYPKSYLSIKFPSAPILTSRGCPFNCTFCAGHNISGKKFRFRSPENIILELQVLKNNYKIKEFQIWDDNFSLNRQRAIEFCDLLIRKKLNLSWWCPNGLRLETLDYELLAKMKEAGCYAIALGIEFGSEKIQTDTKKNLDLEKIREVISTIHALKIRTQGFFMLGYPTETKKDMLKTIQLATSLPLYRATFSLFQPLPGSEIYSVLKKAGKIKTLDFSHLEYSKPSVLPRGFKNKNEIKKVQVKAVINFYARPKIFFRFILENLSFSQLREIIFMVRKYVLNS